MSRMQMFNSPLLLGFDQIERVLDQVSKTKAEGYPPYNIEQVSENELRISIAVAGFSEDDLHVTMEDNQLVIRGKQGEDDSHKVYLHRGIASRQFQRAFILAEGIEVSSAYMDRGLLHIDLTRPVPEPTIREIKIGNKGAKGADASANTIDMPVPRSRSGNMLED